MSAVFDKLMGNVDFGSALVVATRAGDWDAAEVGRRVDLLQDAADALADYIGEGGPFDSRAVLILQEALFEANLYQPARTIRSAYCGAASVARAEALAEAHQD